MLKIFPPQKNLLRPYVFVKCLNLIYLRRQTDCLEISKYPLVVPQKSVWKELMLMRSSQSLCLQYFQYSKGGAAGSAQSLRQKGWYWCQSGQDKSHFQSEQMFLLKNSGKETQPPLCLQSPVTFHLGAFRMMGVVCHCLFLNLSSPYPLSGFFHSDVWVQIYNWPLSPIAGTVDLIWDLLSVLSLHRKFRLGSKHGSQVWLWEEFPSLF